MKSDQLPESAHGHALPSLPYGGLDDARVEWDPLEIPRAETNEIESRPLKGDFFPQSAAMSLLSLENGGKEVMRSGLFSPASHDI